MSMIAGVFVIISDVDWVFCTIKALFCIAQLFIFKIFANCCFQATLLSSKSIYICKLLKWGNRIAN